MLVSKYLPTIDVPLWPCAVLLVVFIPISIWHERNWRRTLSEYAAARIEAGAADDGWPTRGLRRLMGVQPWLIFAVCALLAATVGVAIFSALLWPYTPPGFDLPINPFDLPFLWAMIVAGTAAVVAGLAVALDLRRSPWSQVGHHVRRSMYAPPAERAQRFAAALAADPGVPHDKQPAGAVTPTSAPEAS